MRGREQLDVRRKHELDDVAVDLQRRVADQGVRDEGRASA
jgi:hypothetical protein